MSQVLVFILVQLNWTKKKGTVTFVYKVIKRIRLFDTPRKQLFILLIICLLVDMVNIITNPESFGANLMVITNLINSRGLLAYHF